MQLTTTEDGSIVVGEFGLTPPVVGSPVVALVGTLFPKLFRSTIEQAPLL